MVSITSIAIASILGALIYHYFLKDKRYPGKKPPGPKGLPSLGSLLSISSKPHIRFSEWAKLYGNIFSVKLANYDFVVISDHKLAREAYNNPALLGKPDFTPFKIVAQGNHGKLLLYECDNDKKSFEKDCTEEGAQHPLTVIMYFGEVWQEQRRFLLRNLRDFGFGKSTMHDLAMEEVNDYVHWLKSEEGNSLILNRKFTLATINSLWLIMTGKRFPQNDPRVTAFLDNSNKIFSEMMTSPVIMFFPKLAQALPKVFGWDKVMKMVDDNLAFVKKPIDEHKKEFSTDNTPRDFIDSYLKEIENTTDPKSSFYKQSGEHSLRVVLSDLFGARSETTSSTLVWAIMYLCKHPKMQAKLQEELDQVVGKSRQPTLEDRKNLPYMEAVIQETLRKSTLVPMGIFHSALEDTTVGGYTIVKGSWISVNHYHIHHDPEIWGDPMNFRPERFLSADGKSVLKNDALTAFSVGKRICVGEQIARDNIFLFLTSILQRFSIKFDPAKPEPNMEASSVFFLFADTYSVIMKDRYA